MVKSQAKDPEWHLNDPRVRKWMVQCVICQVIGYCADAPEKFFGRYHLVKHFKPISLDSAGICDDCKQVIDLSQLTIDS